MLHTFCLSFFNHPVRWKPPIKGGFYTGLCINHPNGFLYGACSIKCVATKSVHTMSICLNIHTCPSLYSCLFYICGIVCPRIIFLAKLISTSHSLCSYSTTANWSLVFILEYVVVFFGEHPPFCSFRFFCKCRGCNGSLTRFFFVQCTWKTLMMKNNSFRLLELLFGSSLAIFSQ